MADHPALPNWYQPKYAAMLATRDVRGIFNALKEEGWSQRRISDVTGMRQGEVSAVVHGRRVISVNVLERIAESLNIPLGRMGLGWSVDSRPDLPVPDLIKHSISRMIGDESYEHVNYLLEPSPEFNRIGHKDAKAFNQYFLAIQRLEQEVSGQLYAAQALIRQLQRILRADMSDDVRARLAPMEGWINSFAGWCATDQREYDLAMAHFSTALDIAGKHKDELGKCRALFSAGKTEMHYGEPEQALKLYQLAILPASHLKSNLYNAGLAAHSAWAVSRLEGRDKQHIQRYVGQTWESYGLVNPEREYEDMMSFFNETDILAVTGQAQVATSPELAVEDLTKCLKQRKPGSRSAAFETATLAHAYLESGAGDKAVETGHDALRLISGVQSGRKAVRLAPLKAAAYKYGTHDMHELAEEIRRTTSQ